MSLKVIGVVIGCTTPGESYNEVSVGFIGIVESLSDDWNFTFHKFAEIKVTLRDFLFQNTK